MNLLVKGAHLPAGVVERPNGEGRFLPGRRVDIRIDAGKIVSIGPALEPRRKEDVLLGAQTVVIPGLHDHHIHLPSLVASQGSVAVGPADLEGSRGLSEVLTDAPLDAYGWRRAVGYHESVAGDLDRWALDTLAPGAPVRVQHRTGAVWTVNSSGADALGLDVLDLPGIERDEQGLATGRLFRMDEWLARRLPDARWPDGLPAVSQRLVRLGVTGLTEATPELDEDAVGILAEAVGDGRLCQRLHVMCPPGTDVPDVNRVTTGPCKLLLDDTTLPSLGELVDSMRTVHAASSAVAVHCVTSVQLVLTITALEVAGAVPGDRIEHGSLIPRSIVERIASSGVTVVTNPGLLHTRGDTYLDDVEDRDVRNLYLCASLLESGVPVAAGTDAPFGPVDPWVSVRAACTRLTVGGSKVVPEERVYLGTAVDLFLGEARFPGRVRRLAIGQPGDLCLLADGDLPSTGLSDPVVATVVAGRVVHESR